jgi:uncharacterized delta-60 repeat protein
VLRHGNRPPGAVLTQLGRSSKATAVTTAPDGKIIVGGLVSQRGGKARFALVRYLDNGRVDRTFATYPRAKGPLGVVNAIALQADGKIVAVGRHADNFLVARFLPDGHLDRSFGHGGSIETDYGRLDIPWYVLIQPDGKIVVAGNSDLVGVIDYSRFVVARYNPDGTPDVSFGSAGAALTDFTGDAAVRAIRLADDGTITVGGEHYLDADDFKPELALARLTPTGHPDPTFGTAGVKTAPFLPTANGSPDGTVAGMWFLPDGRAIVEGNAKIRRPKLVMERLLADGTLDQSFGQGGASIFGRAGDFQLAVGADAAGAVFAVNVGFFAKGEGLLLSKYSPNGGFERSFGRHGSSRMAFYFVEASAVTTDRLGRILVVGSAHSRFLLARFRAAGGPDRGFGRARATPHEKHK